MSNFSNNSFFEYPVPSYLFNVVGGENVVRTFDNNEDNLPFFVGSNNAKNVNKEADLVGYNVVRNNYLESVKTFPRQAENFNEESIKQGMLAEWYGMLEAWRFEGGYKLDEPEDPTFRSPIRDIEDGIGNVVQIKAGADLNNDVLTGIASIRQVGKPVVVVNPKFFTSAKLSALVTAVGSLGTVKMLRTISTSGVTFTPKDGAELSVADNVVAFVTSENAFSVTNLNPPTFSKDVNLRKNEVTYRVTGELSGMEVFKYATAVILKENN